MSLPFAFHAQTSDGLSYQDGQLTLILNTESELYQKVYVRHEPDNEESLVEMKPCGKLGRLNQWSATIPVNPDKSLTHYVFKMLSGSAQHWLDARGVHNRIPPREYHFKYDALYQPPEWVNEQIFYQIFPDRFCNGNPDISVKTNEYSVRGGKRNVIAKQWGEPVSSHDSHGSLEFYGGDLAGVRSKLDYLEQLGITTVYLNPIFTSLSNHKYDTTDYFNVDPHLGTNEEFAQLCAEIHQRGMKVVLDAVFNHTSAEHPWFDRFNHYENGAYCSEKSPYRDYYLFDQDNHYACWKGVENLPVLNFLNEEVRDYIYQGKDSVIKHWLRPPYSIDGWRFDVIHMLGEGSGAINNAYYVKQFRDSVKQENQQAYVLGEHFFEATQWLQGDQEDGAMNYYGFAHPVRAWLTGQDIAYDPISISAQEFVEWIVEAQAKVPWLNQLAQLNQLDSHDTMRWATLVNGNDALIEIGLVLLMTMVGTPCVYYGTEVNLQGGLDPDNRRCFPWEETENSMQIERFKKLVAMRRNHLALQQGALQILYAQDGCIAYARVFGGEVILVVINASDVPQSMSVPIWKLGIESGKVICSKSGNEMEVVSGNLSVEVGSKAYLMGMSTKP
ncbi:maltodextrin glucosidase [Vibrio diazotrophicus]|uniref:maltodextrin glucosidase n=1 Tax=Vibrio diazotrophicus TaxID=685 RepID=UPI0022AEFBB8|nr:maltodextrin glucosidase [Vibrio diazotrophicus]MCZ4371000.1 maltodextrin glucosidase [Vibrio diazotrophicus]